MEETKTLEDHLNIEDNKRIKLKNQSSDFIIFTLQELDGNEWEDASDDFAVSFDILKQMYEVVSAFVSVRKIKKMFHILPIQKRFAISPDKTLIFTYVDKKTIEFQIESRIFDNSWLRLPEASFKTNVNSLYTAISMKDELDGTNATILQNIKDQERCKNCVHMEDEEIKKMSLYERVKTNKECRRCFSFLKMIFRKHCKDGKWED